MHKNIESIKFNMTSSMTENLIKFNKLKKEYMKLQNNKKDNKKIKELEKELDTLKYNFIFEFRENNKEQIKDYLDNK